MAEPSAEVASSDDHATPDEPEVILETSPLLRPDLTVVGTIIVIAGLLVGLIVSDPSRVGGASFAEILVNAIVLIVAVVLLRYVVRILVLMRTVYTIHEDGFRREYTLAYRHYERELPVEQLRGKEYDRGRYQSLFDCATIRLLTGGTDRSLGFIEFESVPNPEAVSRTIERVRKRYETSV